jgi:hypothetical protein
MICNVYQLRPLTDFINFDSYTVFLLAENCCMFQGRSFEPGATFILLFRPVVLEITH